MRQHRTSPIIPQWASSNPSRLSVGGFLGSVIGIDRVVDRFGPVSVSGNVNENGSEHGRENENENGSDSHDENCQLTWGV
jgi:hypothetical protein